MRLFTYIFSVFIEALFPLSPEERELFSLSPDQAYATLPHAPLPPLPSTRAIFAYKDDRVSALIWSIKYKKSRKALELGGYSLYMKLSEMNAPQETVLIPIPISAQRRRERGFNQCELLLDEVERADVEHRYVVRKDILVRSRHISRQTLKGRLERLESTEGIFAVQMTHDTNLDQTLIVIDDVITTGSTVREAMETLRSAGFTRVTALSLAH